MDDRQPLTLQAELLRILDDAIEVGSAQRGNVQVFNEALGGLEIGAQRGFDPAFLELFRLVKPDDASICARAWRLRHRVAVADVALDASFAPYLGMARQAGFRAVQSTPLLTRQGRAVGVLSTHFADARHPSASQGILLDHCASRAAALIERLAA